MKRYSKITSAYILFFAVVIADVFAIISNNEQIRFVSKPLLMTFLALVYLFSVKKPKGIYILGLFFSFLGDVFLLGTGQEFFMLGLASFLLAHIIYIKITSSYLDANLTAKMISSAFPFVLFFCLLLYLVADQLGNLLVPVIVYGVTISTFGSVAFLLYRTLKSVPNQWLFIGAIFFIISDSLIALNKFHEPRAYYGLLIMLTYILAQFLICKAMIAKTNDE